MEVFGITFDDEQELGEVCAESIKLQQLVLTVARAHDKTLPGKWTNEVMKKFRGIEIFTVSQLLYFIQNETINHRLTMNGSTGMNPTTLKGFIEIVSGDLSSDFH